MATQKKTTKAPEKKAAPKKTAAKSTAKVTKTAKKETVRRYHNCVIMTDFNCGTANAQVEMRFKNVFMYTAGLLEESKHFPKEMTLMSWAKKEQPVLSPSIINIMDIPFGNVDSAAFSMYACYRALGKSTRPNVFIHVTDPGVGFGDDRCVMITDEGNVFVGPNNGSLGMMAAYFHSRDIHYDIYRIDKQKVEQQERIRMQQDGYHIPSTFHGRDIMAVVAGMVAGGVDPKALAVDEANAYPVLVNQFAGDITMPPLRRGDKVPFYAYRDNTYGNLKTNLTCAPDTLNALIKDGSEYRITKPGGFINRSIKFKANHVFADMTPGHPLLYLGSTFSPNWDERFIELAVNLGNAGDRLNIDPMRAEKLYIERIK